VADFLRVGVEGDQDLDSNALLLPDQAEQEVLGPDVGVPQRPRFFLGQDNHVAGALCESLEQAPKNRSAQER
jgi:hypothetical protein